MVGRRGGQETRRRLARRIRAQIDLIPHWSLRTVISAALLLTGNALGVLTPNIAWCRETFAAMRPHFGSGRWLNYLGDDQAEDAIRAAYGPNYERLGEVKRRYDPDNIFHLNHNIAP